MSQLSGGNQQKVVVGKWLALSPKVLLLNDPTKGVDVGTRQNLYAIISQLTEKGTSVILYASDTEELIDNCDRVLIVFEGRIVKELDRGTTWTRRNSSSPPSTSSTRQEKPSDPKEAGMKTREPCKASCRIPRFPSFLMLVLLVAVNAIIQPGFFSFQVFRMNFMTFTPLILVSLAQATVLLVGAVDLSLGAGISLVTVVMASLMGNLVPSISSSRSRESPWRSYSPCSTGSSSDLRPAAAHPDVRHVHDVVRHRAALLPPPGAHPRGILLDLLADPAVSCPCPWLCCWSPWRSASFWAE